MSKKHQLIHNALQLSEMGLSVSEAVTLQRYAASLHRHHENASNYGLSARQEAHQRGVWGKVVEIATAHGLHVYQQMDPRGWPIIIDAQPIPESASGLQRVCPR
jgi:hypothetical protein